MQTNIYRNGKVHVCARMCSTCIFRDDSTIDRDRVQQMIDDAHADESTIVCHHTIYNDHDQLACRGFFEKHATAPLQIAQRLGCIEYVEPP